MDEISTLAFAELNVSEWVSQNIHTDTSIESSQP
jgi:hypothetical protein